MSGVINKRKHCVRCYKQEEALCPELLTGLITVPGVIGRRKHCPTMPDVIDRWKLGTRCY